MRRFLLLLFVVFLSMTAFAQLEVKEGSFKEVPGFVNINPDENYQLDDNNLPFAVIKVRTENINEKDRKRLSFSGNMGTFINLEYKDGEVWVYLTAQYADYLKISHPDFSSIEFTIPFDLKPKKGYEMTLVNKANAVISGWAALTVTTKPENGAKVLLNGRDINAITPYTYNMIPSGKYEITVSKERYKTITETITIEDGENKNIEIVMPIDVAVITLIADTKTSVYMDGEYKNNGTWSGELKSGNYEIVYKKQYHHDAKQIITVEGGEPKTYELKLLPIFGELDVNSEPLDANILIDGKNYGVTPAKITDIIIGPHELRLEKNSFGTVVKQFVLEEGKLLTVNEALPTGREIAISTGDTGDKIFVDENYIGESPLTATLRFGEHEITAIRGYNGDINALKDLNGGTLKGLNAINAINGVNGIKAAAKTITVSQTGGTTSVQLAFSESKTFTVNGITFEMIAVKGGTFTMGCTSEQSDCRADEKPTHSVTLNDYYIGKFEVTQELWQAVMGSNPSFFKGDNLPVENVSWNDAQEFIKKLNQQTGQNFRLPTEAEWEYAARGGNESRGYKYSGSNNIGDVAWYTDNSGSETHQVGTKSPNELGIYDMSGNVWEWCQDWKGSYSSGSQTNPTGLSSGSGRVVRGGSWYSYAGYCRVSIRNYSGPATSFNSYGFRLVLVP